MIKLKLNLINKNHKQFKYIFKTGTYLYTVAEK